LISQSFCGFLFFVSFTDYELKTFSVNLEKLGESDFEDLEVKVEKISCQFCEEKFFILANLDLHSKRKHRRSLFGFKQIKCVFCSKLLRAKRNYIKHLNVFHKDKGIRCKYRTCFAIFETKKSLKEHVKKVHCLVGGQKCKLCKMWLSSNRLKSHMEKKHATQVLNFKSIKCEFCTEGFDSKFKLFQHTKKTHVSVAFKCQLFNCNLYFQSSEQMKGHFENAHQIKCKFCRSISSCQTAHLIHVKKSHPEKKCKFSRCSFYAGSKDELENHVKEKHYRKLKTFLECIYCGKYLSENRSHLGVHVRKFHSEIAIRCEKRKCAIFFKSLDDLEKHKKEGHQRVERHAKAAECFYCQKTICDQFAYGLHIRTHHSKEAIRCKYKHCFTFFKSECELKKHYEEKHPEKYNCALCGYTTSKRNSFRVHWQSHHLPKEFKCPHCPKLFGSKSILGHHVEIYHKPKKNCPHCKEFGTNLNRHVVTAKCPTCSKPFPCKKLFTDHKLKCKKVHECLECGKQFKIAYFLKQHSKVSGTSGKKCKGWKCKFCEKCFADHKSLKSHQLSEHFEFLKFKCNFCEEAFYCKETIRRHISLKHNFGGFKCKICDKNYYRKRELIIHKQNKHV